MKEPISVSLIYEDSKRKSRISHVIWNRRLYKISKQGLHHTYKRGSNTIHVFEVTSDTISFKLLLDGSSLNWTLDDIYDQNLR